MLALFALACNKDTGGPADTAEAGWRPDVVACPGDASCPDNGGALSAGAALVSVTPTCFESFEDLDGDAELDDDEPFLDCGCDRLCEGDPGWPGADEGEGDGAFQVVWLAGFQNGRPAQGVHDELWARAVVLDQGESRFALVVLDVVGWFYDEVLLTREALPDELAVDHLMVMSTHVHEGPDTMGLWGETATSSGVDRDYNAQIREQTVAAVEAAVADLREVASATTGQVDVRDHHARGALNVLQDKRDPKIVDTTLSALHLADTAGETIATLVHFGNHPEAMADDNGLITSDYVHGLREGVESGVDYDGDGVLEREGLGGVCVYVTGTVGGMMTPLGVTTEVPTGQVHDDYTFDFAMSIGRLKAEMALDALAAGEALDPALSFSASTLLLPVDNYGFQAMFLTGILSRTLYDYDPDESIGEDNTPSIQTEIDHLRLGELEWLSFPGEVLPELAIGGYDGSQVGNDEQDVVDEDNPNPPDLSRAPEGPYYKDLLTSEHRWILGLANDELGYFIPAYNFVLDESLPYFDEAQGDHYEETNSLGAQTAGLLDEAAARHMDWVNTQ